LTLAPSQRRSTVEQALATTARVLEILDMRKIDEAFSDTLKPPCDVIPIQDVLVVSVEPSAHHRPHASAEGI
jgi:hypothetical protein